MLTRTITYKGFDGTEYTEEFRFNITQSELIKANLAQEGGLIARLRAIINAKDGPEIMRQFENIIDMAYGELSPDRKRFIKSPELTAAFKQTDAYNILYVELLTDDEKAAEFIKQILPAVDDKDLAQAKQELGIHVATPY